jgi:hypothetical protein
VPWETIAWVAGGAALGIGIMLLVGGQRREIAA